MIITYQIDNVRITYELNTHVYLYPYYLYIIQANTVRKFHKNWDDFAGKHDVLNVYLCSNTIRLKPTKRRKDSIEENENYTWGEKSNNYTINNSNDIPMPSDLIIRFNVNDIIRV